MIKYIYIVFSFFLALNPTTSHSWDLDIHGGHLVLTSRTPDGSRFEFICDADGTHNGETYIYVWVNGEEIEDSHSLIGIVQASDGPESDVLQTFQATIDHQDDGSGLRSNQLRSKDVNALSNIFSKLSRFSVYIEAAGQDVSFDQTANRDEWLNLDCYR